MKIEKSKISTALIDLFGKEDYHKEIKVGKRYWQYFYGEDDSITKKYGTGWYEIEITYVRSGCVFFIFPKYPDIPEEYFPIRCIFASRLEPSEIDPAKELPTLADNLTLSKIMYYFDDEHTIIKNWDNSPETEITDEEFEKLTPQEQIFITLRI